MKTLFTPFATNFDKTCPLPEYPRPQMVRDSYLNLNGLWDYAICPSGSTRTAYDGKIVVPFSPECALSGVERVLQPTETLHYRRTFTLPKGFLQDVLYLHFGAVDYHAKVFVNGTFVGEHLGGYLPFHFDIAPHIKDGENELTLAVTDPSDTMPQAKGKQRLKHSGIFYTPQSGIWQTVWLESVPKVHIERITLTPNIDADSVSVVVQTNAPAVGTVTVLDAGEVVAEGGLTDGKITLPIPNKKLWTPDTPHLYDLVITAEDDVVESYFGMRKHEIRVDKNGKPRLYLNNEPILHNGLLDQGYYPDGLYTPASDAALIYDVQLTKDMGFNMLRKHIKIEPLRWYYHCDRLGVLVWQDMVNGGMVANSLVHGAYSLLHIKIKDHHYKRFGRGDAFYRAQFEKEAAETIRHLYNVVSLAVWVPFNESWGQFDAVRVTNELKKLDSTRLFDHASGWFDQGGGDFSSWHIYFTALKVPKNESRVIALSEYGGYSVTTKDHVYNTKKEFGYKKFNTHKEMETALVALMHGQVLPLLKDGLSALVYTQLSDVEDETNGLITYDRKVPKLAAADAYQMNQKLYDEFKRVTTKPV